MAKKISDMTRSEISQAKKKLAEKLLREGNTGVFVQEVIEAKYGSGLSTGSIAAIRKNLNSKRDTKKSVKEQQQDILLMQTQFLHDDVMIAVGNLVRLMKMHGILYMTVHETGHVSVTQPQEMEFQV